MSVTHLAIIPDGNRRWAKEQGLPSLEGHRRGYAKVRELGIWAIQQGIEHVSVWGFSTENWKRSAEEVSYLMELMTLALTKELPSYKKEGIRLRVVGLREGLPTGLIRAIETAERETAPGKRGTLHLCINYGGQAEIIEATKRLIEQGVRADELTTERFAQELWFGSVPPADLIVRTSGEQRLSGFMSWSGGYAELFFLQQHFPALTEQDLQDVLEQYEQRTRRFGA